MNHTNKLIAYAKSNCDEMSSSFGNECKIEGIVLMLEVACKALCLIVDPDHRESDDYTRAGCFQHMALEAKNEIEKIASGL